MGRVIGGGVSMEHVAQTLAQYTGRTVVDRTGLRGHFDYDLEFQPDPARQGQGPGGGLPNLVIALQEQLGLTLDPERATVDVLVIDSIERPTEK